MRWLSIALPLLFVTPACAQSVGVNYANGNRWCALPPSTCATDFAHMAAAGVKMVRLPLENYQRDDFGGSINAAANAASYGIAVQLVIEVNSDAEFYPAGTVKRSADPNNPNVYAAYPLSALSPALLYSVLQPVITRIDTAGVTIAGLELANEIGNPAFNGDMPIAGSLGGVTLGAADLAGSDPEAVALTAGFTNYVHAVAMIQAIRNQLPTNWRSPVISAGLHTPADTAAAHVKLPQTEDAPLAAAVMGVLQQAGIDGYVDLYGIHAYPWGTQSQILSQFQTINFPFCGTGHDCAVTEFGYKETSPDTTRQTEVGYMMNAAETFGPALQMISWFDWKSTSYGIYQNGALTGTGSLFLTLP